MFGGEKCDKFEEANFWLFISEEMSVLVTVAIIVDVSDLTNFRHVRLIDCDGI